MTVDAVISKILQNKLLAGARIRCRVPKMTPRRKTIEISMKRPPKPNGVTHAHPHPSTYVVISDVERGASFEEEHKKSGGRTDEDPKPGLELWSSCHHFLQLIHVFLDDDDLVHNVQVDFVSTTNTTQVNSLVSSNDCYLRCLRSIILPFQN